MKKFTAGQRWISESELKLGLGIIESVGQRTVELSFPACGCVRTYSIQSAPLKRVRFNPGDTVQSREGRSLRISLLSEDKGLITYHGKEFDLMESDLKDSISFTNPKSRLQSFSFDHVKDFNFRYRSLCFLNQISQSSVRGFTGGKIDLIPHQLYVAHEAVSRNIPRILLSDETGLGKTIEACLILHRLLQSGQINRVLILVPDSLVHQWFVELLRRFNLNFRIFNKEYKESLTSEDTDPFYYESLCLCSVNLLAADELWSAQAVQAGWDMVIMDEAHHLKEGSPEYELAAELSLKTEGLLLITATPEQFGHQSHFARLKLLDPDRYFDFALFEEEEKQYRKISGEISILLNEKNKSMNDKIVKDLIDRYGTGRSVFRNTRARMTGFPQRHTELISLKGNLKDRSSYTSEFEWDQGFKKDFPSFHYKDDPRVQWLTDFIVKNRDKKLLLICRLKEKAIALNKILKKKIKVQTALFHEDLTLVQRDRNASWFSEQAGAQILICSEIGSEGRNFQFAHNMVFFDLPLDPELLEQRIGRLDRIGQKETINMYVLFIQDCEYSILARWFHEGLNAFQQNVPGSYQIYQEFGQKISQIIQNRQKDRVDDIIIRTKERCSEIAGILKQGRDYLLELNSFHREKAELLISEIKALEERADLEKFMLDVFQLYEIQVEQLQDRTYNLELSYLAFKELPLPVLKRDVFKITFDRAMALNNEDMEFLTWDHPMVTGVLDLITGNEFGNSVFAVWKNDGPQEILLEVIYMLECVAPKELYADRFLPPTPVRVIVNHKFENCDQLYPVELCNAHTVHSKEFDLLDDSRIRQELFPEMLDKAEQLAEKTAELERSRGQEKIDSTVLTELNRLRELKKINKNITPHHVDVCEQEISSLQKAISSSRLRLDSLRLILKGEMEEPEKSKS